MSEDKQESLSAIEFEKQQTGAEADLSSPILSMGDIPKPDSPILQTNPIKYEYSL